MNEVYLQLHKKINKHTDQLISVNALGLAHKTIQFYAIKFVQKYYQPLNFQADNIYCTMLHLFDDLSLDKIIPKNNDADDR